MIGWMAKEFFLRSPVLMLPVIALVIFMVAFVGITLRTLRARKQDMGRLAQLPFESEEGRHD